MYGSTNKIMQHRNLLAINVWQHQKIYVMTAKHVQ